MKRLSILVLVIFVLVAALAACTPTPPPEEPETPHEHQFTDVWCADATYHWHVDTCDHEEEAVASKFEHRDANTDGICDVCDYYIYYTFTVDAPDFVTVKGDLTGKNEDVTFTAEAPAYYTLYADGAEQVGDAVVENGVATYTFKVANLASPDVEVEITYKQTAYVNVVASADGAFLPEGDATSIPAWKNIYTDVTINIPKAGTYTLKASHSSVTLALSGETTYSAEYTLVADEAGEYTISAKVFLWSSVESLEFTVSAMDLYETEADFDELSGEGVLIPAGENFTLNFVVPTPGRYVFTANDNLRVGGDALYSYWFETSKENEEISIYVAIDEYYDGGSTVILDWNISEGTANELVLGDNNVTVHAYDIYAMSFVVPEDGQYMITDSDSSYSYGSWGTYGWGYPYIYAGEAVTLSEGDVLEFAYFNYGFEDVELTVTVAKYVPAVVETKDLVLGNTQIEAANANYKYTATEAGTLNIALDGAVAGSVELRYSVNGGDFTYIYTNNNADVVLNVGDEVIIEALAEGYATMTTTWTADEDENEGGNTPAEPDGSEEHPYIFDGTENLFVSINSGSSVYVTVKGGVTAYLDFEGYFMVDNSPALSVSPTVDTTYEVCANNPMLGAMGYITTTAPADEPDGSEEHPYVFDGSADIEFELADWFGGISVTVKGGVTAYIDGDAQFYDPADTSSPLGTSVTPTEDTTYLVLANTSAGALGAITATEPDEGEEGNEAGQEPTVESTLKIGGTTQINATNAEYVFYAETDGALTLTQGACIMADVEITYTINSSDAVTLVAQEAVTIELTKGDIVTIVITANGGYSSLTAQWSNE